MEQKHFNGLTPAEAERLAVLMEEMAEASQIIGKILRHGYASRNPHDHSGGARSNREMLEQELGDVRHAMILLCDANDLSKDAIHERAKAKVWLSAKWMHHQPPAGAPDA
jgi:NTP pyrophosphatase (non-canonical NTP hydrolase)